VDLGTTLDRHRERLASLPALSVGASYAGSRAIGGHGPAAPYRIASLTKAFTSAALLLELRERRIPTSTPVADLLPDLVADWRADHGLTIDQLLGQVSGLRESVDAAAVAALGDGADAISASARLVLAAGNLRSPGTAWSYYNGNYFLAGALLEALSGSSYETALRRRLLDPWRLGRTAFDGPATYPRGRRPSGGLWSCVDDLLTFGEQLLSDTELLAQLARRRTPPGDPMAYGAGWAIGPSGQLFLNGRLPDYRAALLLVPADGLVAVALAHHEEALPALAAVLSDLQHPFTGDDLSAAIDAFAA
jgi:D-alanyl-D-alanine carboxypeptidase